MYNNKKIIKSLTYKHFRYLLRFKNGNKIYKKQLFGITIVVIVMYCRWVIPNLSSLGKLFKIQLHDLTYTTYYMTYWQGKLNKSLYSFLNFTSKNTN